MSENNDVRDVKINACKCTLSTGKVVYLRMPRIGDTEDAARVAGMQADPKNAVHLGMVLQKELVKKLLLQVDEQKLKLEDKEDLNKLFEFTEYTELQKAINKLTGAGEAEDTGKKSVTEFVVFGSK